MYYCFCVLSYREARGFEVRGGIAAVIATSLFRRRRLPATKVLLFLHIRKYSIDIFVKWYMNISIKAINASHSLSYSLHYSTMWANDLLRHLLPLDYIYFPISMHKLTSNKKSTYQSKCFFVEIYIWGLYYAAKAHECHSQEAGSQECDRSTLQCFRHFS